MNVINVNNSNFEEIVLKATNLVVVDFNAQWCGPCQLLKPVIEELAKENENVTFVSVDIDSANGLAEYYNIVSIPCLIYFKNGIEIKRTVGLKSKKEIKNIIGEL